MTTSLPLLAKGSRTAIREFTRSDVDAWLEWPPHTDPLFRDYNPPQMRAAERDIWYFERLRRPDHKMYAILNEHGDLIGKLFLRQIDRNARTAVLGIDLRSDVLNQGYGSDALSTFCDYYFQELGLSALKLDVAAYNDRARHVYESLGFVRTGEHWTIYPSSLLPDVFADDRFAAIRPYFRMGSGTISVLHYDMILTAETWQHRRSHEG